MKKMWMDLLSLCLYLLLVVGTAYLVIHYVGQRMEVNGSSMEPTLQADDQVLINKWIYRLQAPKRFDIIVFPYRYEEDTYYVKRIIGLPGERIWIDKQGTIWVDGEPLEEHYGAEKMHNPGIAVTPRMLSEGEYFVLGDNRNDSSDSRDADVGLVRRSEIIGKVVWRMQPLSSMGAVE